MPEKYEADIQVSKATSKSLILGNGNYSQKDGRRSPRTGSITTALNVKLNPVS
jgi:hypothetical protein